FAKISQGSSRKNYSPAKGVVRSVALVDDDFVRGVGLFHEDGKVHSRRAATDDVDFHSRSSALVVETKNSSPTAWHNTRSQLQFIPVLNHHLQEIFGVKKSINDDFGMKHPVLIMLWFKPYIGSFIYDFFEPITKCIAAF